MRLSNFVLALAIVVSSQTFAYDGFESDLAKCTQGKNPAEVVAACTRLIDNAEVENSTVGMFYGLRAANSNDRAQSYPDARKSLDVADDEAIKELSQKLIDANC